MYIFLSIFTIDFIILFSLLGLIIQLTHQEILHTEERYRKELTDSQIVEDTDDNFGEEEYQDPTDIIYILSIQLQRYFAVQENRKKLLTILTKNENEMTINDIIHSCHYIYPVEINNSIVELFNVKNEFNNMLHTYGETYFHYTSNINVIPIFITEEDSIHHTNDILSDCIYVSFRKLHFYYWFFENVYDNIT